ncbi:MAG: HD domain-containing protein [Fimbriimonas sp.]|nr:HD domain-containing protein [Fimbriimonas sp.]
MKKLQAAIELATRLHDGHWRDGDSPLPYITHPIEVMANLRYVGRVTDEDLLCAAILHDTVECGASLEVIDEAMGNRVSDLVLELTRREPEPDQLSGLSKKEIWYLRAVMLIEEVSVMSPDAQQIKLADRLANLREAFRSKSRGKLERYLWQTVEILKVVPRKHNQWLWDAIRSDCDLGRR